MKNKSNPLKTLFLITHQFPPKNIVGALRPFRLAREIGGRRWRVVIITHLPSLRDSLDFSLLNELSPGTHIHYIDKANPLIINHKDCYDWIFQNNFKRRFEKILHKHRILYRVWGAGLDILRKMVVPDVDLVSVPFYILKVHRLIKKAKNPVLFTTSPPHSIHLAGLILSQFNKIPWIADFRDPWDHYPTRQNFEIENPVEKFLEKKVVVAADAIISTTKTNTHILKQRHPELPREKFYTVTNCFEKNKCSVEGITDPNKFVISYTGIFYPEKDPFTFFRALRSWIDQLGPEKKTWVENVLEVKLIGSKTSVVEKVIEELNLKKVVTFIKRVPHQEAVRLTKGSDLVLISSGLGKKTRPGWLPSKLFEYLGCKVPILAIIPEGEMAQIIRKTNSGYVVTSEDHPKIHNILEAELQRKFSKKSFPFVEEKFSFEKIEAYEVKRVVGDMINIIECVANRRKDSVNV